MCKSYRKLEGWKTLLAGKIFTFLTVIDVIQSIIKRGKKEYFAVCRCQCCAECFKRVYGVIMGHNKSYGCY